MDHLRNNEGSLTHYEGRPNAPPLQHTLVNPANYEDHLNAPAAVPVDASCGSADL